MKSAYDLTGVYNLEVIKQTKRWFKHKLIEESQMNAIHQAYACPFYHPNFIIRIVLFVATLLVLSGITGLLILMIADAGDNLISVACIFYGLISFLILEKLFIENNHHFKSGVTEALLYHSCGFIIGGIAGVTDFDQHITALTCLVVFSFAAFRYLDLVCCLCAIASIVYILFFECYLISFARPLIPFIFIICFGLIYWFVKKVKSNNMYSLRINVITLVEACSLILIYAAGNYLVVRELSVNLMESGIEPSDEIPFAFLFYGLTVLIPILYLYYGIKNKDVVILRVSLFVIAFSVFTFKYYYGFGHPEITLTIGGALLLLITLLIMNFLKTMRSGYTRENLLTEKWGDANLHAILVSQTMGGNTGVANDQFKGDGGEFGGGGATGSF
jgi:hypothetical protein